jgi:hypothetical protein
MDIHPSEFAVLIFKVPSFWSNLTDEVSVGFPFGQFLQIACQLSEAHRDAGPVNS